MSEVPLYPKPQTLPQASNGPDSQPWASTSNVQKGRTGVLDRTGSLAAQSRCIHVIRFLMSEAPLYIHEIRFLMSEVPLYCRRATAQTRNPGHQPRMSRRVLRIERGHWHRLFTRDPTSPDRFQSPPLSFYIYIYIYIDIDRYIYRYVYIYVSISISISIYIIIREYMYNIGMVRKYVWTREYYGTTCLLREFMYSYMAMYSFP